MANQIVLTLPRMTDGNGAVAAGAKATFYRTGTTLPVTVYTDEALSVAHASPVVADSTGKFAQIFYGGSTNVKVVITDSADVTLLQMDPAPMISLSGSAASNVSFAPVSGNAATNVQTAIANNVTTLAARVPLTRTLTVGTGLTGGGDLSADRSIALAINGSVGPTATTSGTAVTFAGIPATARAVDIIFNGVSLSGTDHILVQLSTGATYVTSGYTAGWVTFATSTATSNTSTAAFPVGMGNATRVANGMLRLVKEPTSDVWACSGGIFRGNGEMVQVFGSVNVAGTLDELRLQTSGSDTFDAGQASIVWHL